jgi:hypothetical protein
MAPAKVLHGAVRLQGLASSPTPETQVRVAWAKAPVEKPRKRTAAKTNPRVLEYFIEVERLGLRITVR